VGRSVHPDLDGLDAMRRDSLARVRSGWHERPAFEQEARVSFHVHTIATAVLGAGTDALLAARLAGPDQVAATRARWFGEDFSRSGRLAGIGRYSGVIARHASVRSVWFVNSVRGSIALAAAVAVADTSSVQHGFWVALGTLSVLRTNASATGATAVRALLGTMIGF